MEPLELSSIVPTSQLVGTSKTTLYSPKFLKVVSQSITRLAKTRTMIILSFVIINSLLFKMFHL
nr:MAG TPA: hypothetical protein [Caudoviricetes sp.]